MSLNIAFYYSGVLIPTRSLAINAVRLRLALFGSVNPNSYLEPKL